MTRQIDQQKGVIRLIFIVIAGVIILSYFGVNSEAVVENKFVQTLIELFKKFWK
jgi:hypothetical protein